MGGQDARAGEHLVFDLELLGHLIAGADGAAPLVPDDLLDIPLKSWVDVCGSKLSVKGALRDLGARVKTGGMQEFVPR